MITAIVKRISSVIKLIEIEKEAPETYTFKFELPKNSKWTPGAYAHFLSSDLQNGETVSKKLVRELSIMSHPDEKFIGFTTRIRQNPSEFKQTMLILKPDDEIRMFKIGNHYKNLKTEKPVVLISMGVGIATFRPIILEYLKSAPNLSITNINIDRTGSFIYRKELESLSTNYLKNVFVNSRTDLYTEINRCITHKDNNYYVVGSKEFNETIRDFLIKNNVSKNAILLDK
jgi:ferredoxin--NADP+ reductase